MEPVDGKRVRAVIRKAWCEASKPSEAWSAASKALSPYLPRGQAGPPEPAPTSTPLRFEQFLEACSTPSLLLSPPTPLPPPLSGEDGGFTKHSIISRLPAILEETLRASGAPHPLVEAVRRELCEPLAAGKLLPPPPTDAEGLWAPSTPSSPNSLPSSWWYQENVVYRHLLALWEKHGLGDSSSSPSPQDPFQAQKEDALKSSRDAFLAGFIEGEEEEEEGLTASPPSEALLARSLLRSLWGNRADLSLSAGKVVKGEGGEAGGRVEDLLLANDIPRATSLLLSPSIHKVAIILDNCGLELLQDLRLADVLLRLGQTQGAGKSSVIVTLVTKTHPVFVSDAMAKDVMEHLAWLLNAPGAGAGAGSAGGVGDAPAAPATPATLAAVGALGARLQGALTRGSLALFTHPFWVSARPGWGMPVEVEEWLAGQDFVVVKGDANYRRLVGDLHWGHDTPFQSVVGSYTPCPLLALRTCKAGVVVGVSKEAEARVVAAEGGGGGEGDDWLVSGKYGVVQLALPW